jgi:riboflavin biosynthesis pyrimidine reductase
LTDSNLRSDWSARFHVFSARWLGAARAARLTPFTTEIDAGAPGLLSIGNAWSQRMWDGPFRLSPPPSPDLPAVSLAFVQSLDGNTGAAGPSALGGGPTDTHLIYEGLSRAAADAVMAGAGTIRGADSVFSVWREELIALRTSLGKPRHPVHIVATLAGLDLDSQLLFNVPDVPVVLLTVDAGLDAMRDALRARPWITALAMSHQTDLTPAFREMRRMGIARISAVGGRTTATSLVDALVTRKRGTGDESGVVFDYLILTSNSLGQSLPVTNSRS